MRSRTYILDSKTLKLYKIQCNIVQETYHEDNYPDLNVKQGIGNILGDHYVTILEYNPKEYRTDIVQTNEYDIYDYIEKKDPKKKKKNIDMTDIFNTYLNRWKYTSGAFLNGGFFNEDTIKPLGYIKGYQLEKGKIMESQTPIYNEIKKYYGYITISKSGKVEIHNGPVLKNKEKYSKILQSVPILLSNGNINFTKEICLKNKNFNWKSFKSGKIKLHHACNPNPRSAFGIKENGNIVFAIVEGRFNRGKGLDLYQFACVLKSLKVRDAINTDGGKSSNILRKYRSKKGIVSVRELKGTTDQNVVSSYVPNFITACKK